MSNSEPVSSLKGIERKPENYLKSWGSSLLMTFFPIIQEHDTYEPPVPVGQLKEQMVMGVAAAPSKPPDLLRTGKIQMVCLCS